MQIIDADAVNADIEKQCLAILERHGGMGLETVCQAMAHGTRIVGMYPEENEDLDELGFYDADKNAICINLGHLEKLASIESGIEHDHRAAALVDDLIFALVHEAQHAINLHEGLILSEEEAFKRGRERYTKNVAWDEAYAWARSYIVANEMQWNRQLEVSELSEIYADVEYNPETPDALEYYAQHAMGYLMQPHSPYYQDIVGEYDKLTAEILAVAEEEGPNFAERFAKRNPLKPDGSAKGV